MKIVAVQLPRVVTSVSIVKSYVPRSVWERLDTLSGTARITSEFSRVAVRLSKLLLWVAKALFCLLPSPVLANWNFHEVQSLFKSGHDAYHGAGEE